MGESFFSLDVYYKINQESLRTSSGNSVLQNKSRVNANLEWQMFARLSGDTRHEVRRHESPNDN